MVSIISDHSFLTDTNCSDVGQYPEACEFERIMLRHHSCCTYAVNEQRVEWADLGVLLTLTFDL
jgi:hypothetical protein